MREAGKVMMVKPTTLQGAFFFFFFSPGSAQAETLRVVEISCMLETFIFH